MLWLIAVGLLLSQPCLASTCLHLHVAWSLMCAVLMIALVSGWFAVFVPSVGNADAEAGLSGSHTL